MITSRIWLINLVKFSSVSEQFICLDLCPHLPSIGNGSFTYNYYPLSVGVETAVLNCNDGYTFDTINVRDVVLDCEVGGVWSMSTLPTCIREQNCFKNSKTFSPMPTFSVPSSALVDECNIQQDFKSRRNHCHYNMSQ